MTWDSAFVQFFQLIAVGAALVFALLVILYLEMPQRSILALRRRNKSDS